MSALILGAMWVMAYSCNPYGQSLLQLQANTPGSSGARLDEAFKLIAGERTVWTFGEAKFEP